MDICGVIRSFNWCTFVVSNVLLRVPKNESNFRHTEEADFTDYEY